MDSKLTGFTEVFEGKKVLITGHTGFKGSWLGCWLKLLGADVVGVSLGEVSHPSHYGLIGADRIFSRSYEHDLRNPGLLKILTDERPDFIFHLAAQALVGRSYSDPADTWLTNVGATISVLDSLRSVDWRCVAVFITSDKCYENKEWVWGYRETDELGGADPYSSSKAACELAISSYVRSFFSGPDVSVKIASARAGNVIGGGDWAENRIVPDAVQSWNSGNILDIRNPLSTRPWQHVLEPLGGYLRLAEQMFVGEQVHGESFNFGPSGTSEHTVGEVVSRLSRSLPNLNWIVNDDALSGPMKESGLLKLDCDKAMRLLGWRSVLGFEPTIDLTADWYVRFFCKGEPAIEITFDHICSYHPALAKSFEGGMA